METADPPRMVQVPIKEPVKVPEKVVEYVKFLYDAAKKLQYQTGFAKPEQYMTVLQYIQWANANATDPIAIPMLQNWVVLVRDWI